MSLQKALQGVKNCLRANMCFSLPENPDSFSTSFTLLFHQFIRFLMEFPKHLELLLFFYSMHTSRCGKHPAGQSYQAVPCGLSLGAEDRGFRGSYAQSAVGFQETQRCWNLSWKIPFQELNLREWRSDEERKKKKEDGLKEESLAALRTGRVWYTQSPGWFWEEKVWASSREQVPAFHTGEWELGGNHRALEATGR